MNSPILISLLSALLLALAGCSDSSEHEDHGDEHSEARAEAHANEEKESGHKAPEHEESGREEEHEGHEEEGGRQISLTAEQRKLLDLQTSVARGGRADEMIVVPATTHFNQNRISHVGPLLPGRVATVEADLGQQVKRGDPLAILISPELGRAKARFLRLAAEREAARADWQRQQRLAKQDIASEADLLDAKARYRATAAELDAAQASLLAMGLSEADIDKIDSDAALNRYVLTSPQDGAVEKRDLAPGQQLSSSDSPFLVAATDSLWVFADVYEKSASVVAAGQAVRFKAAGAAGALEGKVDWVANHLDETSRTLRVRAVVNNSEANLKAGQYGQLMILREAERPVPLVPVDAVQQINGRSHVFVPTEQPGQYQAREVSTAEEGHGLVEITSGIDIGTTVVAAGAFDLKSALTASGRSAAHSH
jgi:cobalt-zinc-cadmium efflux system membrane fusion protein